jgi:two-component system, sensor histidine kinase RpfC
VSRSSIASLGPALFHAAAEPVAPPSGPPPSAPKPGERPTAARIARLTVFGLGLAGVLPPLAFTARPGELGLIGAVPVSIALTGLLILAPALVGLVAALFGLEGVRESFRVRGDKEHEQAVLRIFVAALSVIYGFAMETYGTAAAPCEIVAAVGLAVAWIFLLLTILDPIPSPLRYYVGTIADAVLLSAFLHFGAALTAPWFPVYLLVSFYAGFRFGPAALAVSSVANLAGFVVVVATTAFWQQQALLAAGLLVAMIALPAYVGNIVREVAQSRAAAATAQAARTRFLMVISQALRGPLDAMIGSAGAGEQADRAAATPAASARTLLSQVNNILDFSAIEAGAFVPAIEAFDLHRLVNKTLADRRAEAKSRGLRLRVHIDPALPYRLRGWPQQLAQILDYLVARAIEVTPAGAIRIAIDSAGGEGNTVNLRLAVRDQGSPIAPADAEIIFDPFANSATSAAAPMPSAHGAFGLAVVKRLSELMGGRIAIDTGTGQGGKLTVTFPIVVDEPATEPELDLDHCLVLIATEDSQFASELAEPLNAWHGDPRWIAGFSGTLGFERRDAAACSILIVDGRTHTLAALSFAHRAVTGPTAPSFVLVVAEPARIEGLMELADAELDGVLAAPLDAQLLASALHSLPLWQGASARPVMVPEADDRLTVQEAPAVVFEQPIIPAQNAAAAAMPQVTPISVHPRFGAETPTVDPRAIAALRGLGDGEDFLAEIIDSFRVETKEIMHRVVRAAAVADASGFARGLHALRNCAGNLGGTRLCDLLLALRDISAHELREQGSVIVQRLGDELARLDAALIEYLPERGMTRRGA